MTQLEARRLRAEEGLSIAAIQARLGVTKHTLTGWLRGVPAPEWTRRPQAKDELRARAVALRQRGWSVNDIALELGVTRSTSWQWVRQLPLDPDTDRARQKRAHAKAMTDARWSAHRARRDAARAAVWSEMAATVGPLTDRELLMIGAALYWCEGRKAKPWREEYRLVFTNSDPALVGLFIRFMAVLGVPIGDLRFRVAIHASADVREASRWWIDRLELPTECFLRPTIKQHKVATNRHNTGQDYHGCLVVEVPRSREHYWRVEGIIRALAEAGNV